MVAGVSNTAAAPTKPELLEKKSKPAAETKTENRGIGRPSVYVTPLDFLPAEWNALVKAGYVDNKGKILPKFTGKEKDFKIAGLDNKDNKAKKTLFEFLRFELYISNAIYLLNKRFTSVAVDCFQAGRIKEFIKNQLLLRGHINGESFRAFLLGLADEKGYRLDISKEGWSALFGNQDKELNEKDNLDLEGLVLRLTELDDHYGMIENGSGKFLQLLRADDFVLLSPDLKEFAGICFTKLKEARPEFIKYVEQASRQIADIYGETSDEYEELTELIRDLKSDGDKADWNALKLLGCSNKLLELLMGLYEEDFGRYLETQKIKVADETGVLSGEEFTTLFLHWCLAGSKQEQKAFEEESLTKRDWLTRKFTGENFMIDLFALTNYHRLHGDEVKAQKQKLTELPADTGNSVHSVPAGKDPSSILINQEHLQKELAS